MLKLKILSRYLLIFLLYNAVSSCSSGGKVHPIKPYQLLNIEDGELLVYSKYISGEKSFTSYFVTRTDITNKRLLVFIESLKKGSESNLPASLTDFSYKIDISTELGSLNEIKYSNKDKPVNLLNTSYPVFINLKVNNRDNRGEYIMKNLINGTERIATSRFYFKKGFPVWNAATLLFLGPRLFDIRSDGVFLMIEPEFVKDPVEGFFILYGKEKIKTPAGEFNTLKLGLRAMDPFLGKLLSGLTDNLLFWIEDSPRRLMVKSQFGEIVNELDQVSSWNGNKTNMESRYAGYKLN